MAERRRAARIAGAREAAALVATLGGIVRHERRLARLSQADLATRVGIRQSRLSEFERGLGAGAPLEVWVALGIALGRPLSVEFTRSADAAATVRDAGHLAMQEVVLRLAATRGISGTFELPTRPHDPARSIDVCLRDDVGRRLIVAECWNRFGDLGAAARSSSAKLAELAGLANGAVGERPYAVHLVWLIRPTAANRELLRTYPAVLRSRFRGSSEGWARSISEGTPPPNEPGIAWLEPTTGRVTAVRWRVVVAP